MEKILVPLKPVEVLPWISVQPRFPKSQSSAKNYYYFVYGNTLYVPDSFQTPCSKEHRLSTGTQKSRGEEEGGTYFFFFRFLFNIYVIHSSQQKWIFKKDLNLERAGASQMRPRRTCHAQKTKSKKIQQCLSEKLTEYSSLYRKRGFLASGPKTME